MRDGAALFTDLYELSMVQAYQHEGLTGEAVFELFYRTLPSKRRYMLAAGVADVVAWLEKLHFDEDDLAFLREQPQFSDDFVDRLRDFRFTGDVYAMREGTAAFPDEPIVQVIAPLDQAQLIETYVLNQLHFQSVAASKAARIVHAAQGRAVVDFGSRRSHGEDAALKVARTSYIAGAAGTSNVLAGKLYGIPLFGTMAHSYIQAHDSEVDAFNRFADLYPGTTLLVDTYDTLEGVRRVIDMSRKLGEKFNVASIRLDSGDLLQLSREARKLLDDAGLTEMKIIASSGLDEYKIADLVAGGAPIDGFGVGTKLAVAEDVPTVDFAYKLVAYEGQGRIKLSASKRTLPGRKQVDRVMKSGKLVHDIVKAHDEPIEGEPLLEPVMRAGERVGESPSIDALREHAAAQLALLPDALHSLDSTDTDPLSKGESPWRPVRISESLERAYQQLQQTYAG